MYIVLLIILTFGCIGMVSVYGDVINNGEWGNNTYIVLDSINDFTQAVTDCEYLGLNLTSISSKEENEYIRALCSDSSAFTDRYDCAIGLHKYGLHSLMSWSWEDDSMYNYTNWITNETLFSNGCGVINPITGLWKIMSCTDMNNSYAVCKANGWDVFSLTFGGDPGNPDPSIFYPSSSNELPSSENKVKITTICVIIALLLVTCFGIGIHCVRKINNRQIEYEMHQIVHRAQTIFDVLNRPEICKETIDLVVFVTTKTR
jgi:hypothetical protein